MPVLDGKTLKQWPKLEDHFGRQRVAFYHAELFYRFRRPNELNGFFRILIFVVAVHVRFELAAVTDDSLPPLLKGTFHVLTGCYSQVGPESVLFSSRS